MNKPVLWIPWTVRNFCIHGKWIFPGWLGIIIVKIIDHLFNPYRSFRRQTSVLKISPNVGVGCFINVNGKCGERILGSGQEWIFYYAIVIFCIEPRSIAIWKDLS